MLQKRLQDWSSFCRESWTFLGRKTDSIPPLSDLEDDDEGMLRLGVLQLLPAQEKADELLRLIFKCKPHNRINAWIIWYEDSVIRKWFCSEKNNLSISFVVCIAQGNDLNCVGSGGG
jgi:hypothetical protein